jgi:hypothetical protein
MGSKLYSLLLYLYPRSFRREYGEAMLQLFNDQRRAVRGAGGHAMLWLKTLRDLVLSVPAAHASDRSGTSPSPQTVVMLWATVAVLGVVFLLSAVVLPNSISRLPSAHEVALVATPQFGPPGEYRTVAQVAAVLVSALLAIGALRFALRQRRMLSGVPVFVVGAALTFSALATNPWIWLPEQYPVAIAWALGIWPLAAGAWIVLAVSRRRNTGV